MSEWIVRALAGLCAGIILATLFDEIRVHFLALKHAPALIKDAENYANYSVD